MPILEDAKKTIEQLTGYGRPERRDVADLIRPRKPHTFRFKDDGETPNNAKLPLILYRTPVVLRGPFDAAAIFEDVFAKNGWKDSWRNGIYEFLHFHTRTHEVLGIAHGSVRIELGGAEGKRLPLKAGDVVILPAGTGHRRVAASRDLLVVGAYPGQGTYDEPKPGDIDHDDAVAAIARVHLPNKDPVYGKSGPLMKLWRRPRQERAHFFA